MERGTISVAPFCSVKSSSNQMLLVWQAMVAVVLGKVCPHEVSVALPPDVECLPETAQMKQLMIGGATENEVHDFR